eukprot:1296298-Prymnesium_polylepis.1
MFYSHAGWFRGRGRCGTVSTAIGTHSSGTHLQRCVKVVGPLKHWGSWIDRPDGGAHVLLP